MEKTEVKIAAANDIPLIISLAMQVWPQTYTPILGPEQVKYMLDKFYTPVALLSQMQDAGHQFIIGSHGGEPVAFASWSQTEPGIYKLHKIYIIPGRQGKGIGRSLLSFIVASIRAKQATHLRLNVNIYNTPAKAFYEKAGFTHLADEDIDIGNGYFMNDHILSLAV